ncbi:MAG: BlaI/MecI/CopY family transcriptional regulator [Lachnospiraceae bacterium]|nr:BlaI/MecI/CopY family transcriptional regulator [Lachnospiraceae bacterium]
MGKFKLTSRERDLMEIFWKADKALAGSDFPNYDRTLKSNTANIYLRKLLDKGLIKISDYEMRKNIITRTYVPSLSKQEYETEKFFHSLNKYEFNTALFIASLFDENINEENELKELLKLEKIINERKAKFAVEGTKSL